MRVAVINNMISPYTSPFFERLAEREDCELLVVYETDMEPSRHWRPQASLPYRSVVLHSWTLDLSALAVGSGFRTRGDTFLYIPKRPLAALAAFRPDVVIASGGGIWSSPANLVALGARTRRGWAYVPWWGSFGRPKPTLPRRLANGFVRAFVRSGDAWMAYGARSFADLVSLGADPARIRVVPLVARPPTAPPVQNGRDRRDRPMRFLFVGRLIERKGVDVLLEAFRTLGNAELWIAGDGPMEELVHAAAAGDSRIRVLGHRGDSELDELYRSADALVITSHYEVWGLVVNEALAYGLPVIATDQVGAAPDLIDDGVNGRIVTAGSVSALADAMRDLESWDHDRVERCAARCREKLAERSLERVTQATMDACELAVEHRRGRTKTRRRATSAGSEH